jgi:phospholipid/cholesterol/gamma-HCH transport system substrate-binding protein
VAETNNKPEVVLPKKSLAVEFYVGLFAIIGLVCFAYLAINIGGMRLGSAGYYKVYAEFDNISGLKVGSPVEIAGVQVGEVVNVALKTTSAVVTLLIKNGVTLRDDDIVAVRTKGIIGDKYIRIQPGGSDKPVQNGATLKDTESAIEFEEIIGKFIHKME